MDTQQDTKFLKFLNELKSFYSGVHNVLDGEFYSFSSKYQVVWKHNNTRLLRFEANNNPPQTNCLRSPRPISLRQGFGRQEGLGMTGDRYYAHSNDTPTIFILPSLINKGHILDVMKGYSLIEFLTTHGFSCYLLDWRDPTLSEAHFKIEDYYTHKILPALDLIKKTHSNIVLLGYCLGGTLSLITAALNEDKIKGTVLLTSPWDFSYYKEKVLLFQHSIDYLLTNYPLISSTFIRNFFLYFTPKEKIYKKFTRLAETQDSDVTRDLFIRVEKWSLDNMYISNGVFNEVFFNFALRNTLLKNAYRIAGKPIHLDKIKTKCLIISGKNDAVVPYQSTLPLIDHLPNKHTVLSDSGHVGILIGKNAKKDWWNLLVDWLASL